MFALWIRASVFEHHHCNAERVVVMNAKWIPVIAAWGVIVSVGGLFRHEETNRAEAETAVSKSAPSEKSLFELKDGDRVVLLGGTMIEREQRHGSWEMLLTAQHPDKNITFRNLGWSGDTVWAESRGIFDPPAEGYRRMIEQVRGLQPTVLFFGYGFNESFAGKAGLEKFLAQYKKLLQDLQPTNARFVFLGPPAHNSRAFPLDDSAERDEQIKLYRDAIQQLAVEHQAPFVDLYQSIHEWLATTQKFSDVPFEPISDNGVHWNSRGYGYTALFLGRCSGWPTPRWDLTLSAQGKAEPDDAVQVANLQKTKNGLTFEATSRVLPLSNDYGHNLIVDGLDDGQYVLEVNGEKAAQGDQQEWADGVLVSAGPDFEQSQRLRKAIQQKNRLYFYRWRPQNVTYLFGFRKHEQGQNAQEVPKFDPLIAEQEQRIHQLKKPKPHKYALRRVSP